MLDVDIDAQVRASEDLSRLRDASELALDELRAIRDDVHIIRGHTQELVSGAHYLVGLLVFILGLLLLR